MLTQWRPLTNKELPDLSSGDTVSVRENYLSNPDGLPVTYVAAVCLEKRAQDGTFLIDGIHQTVRLTEVGRYVATGWQLSGAELGKLHPGDPVGIYADSGQVSAARFVSGASPYTAKVIFAGATEPVLVGIRSIGKPLEEPIGPDGWSNTPHIYG